MTQAGDPTPGEIETARAWLAKHGVHVPRPTRLLSIRLGTRKRARWTRLSYYWFLAILAICGAVGYQALQYLPNVRGKDMTESNALYFVYMALQFTTWLTGRKQDRRALQRLSLPATSFPRRSSWQVLGGWFIAGTVTTFGGGAALGVAMYLTTSARTYAWSWLGLLALSAIATTVTVNGVLRAPTIAEDEGSLAVDELVRTENAFALFPAMFAIPVLFDLISDNRQPHTFTWLLVGYAALSVGLQTVGIILNRRRRLPGADDPRPALVEDEAR